MTSLATSSLDCGFCSVMRFPSRTTCDDGGCGRVEEKSAP